MTALKDRIVQEALRQFSYKGYMHTSTMDIIQSVGTSKGGLYNHFKNKERLFFEALSHARKLWRERNLAGVDEIARPLDKIIKILINYKERYLKDEENLPGGCVFVNLAVELNDQQPHLAEAVTEGFTRLKSMFKRLLSQDRDRGGITLSDEEMDHVVELLFASLLGACVMYASTKSEQNLDMAIASLIDYLNQIRH